MGKMYRRDLPHIDGDGRPVHVNFGTRDGFILPEGVRGLAMKCCLAENGKKYTLHCAMVMPDHVHLIISLLEDRESGERYRLAEVMQGIKGASAHAINKVLGRRGSVWREESFDRIVRPSESGEEKTRYIRENPVRKGLVKKAEEWMWYWEAEKDGHGT